MFTTLFGFLTTITSIVGSIAFFCDATPLLLICAGLSIVNSLIQVIWGDQKNLSTEIVTVILFLIISFFVEPTWYVMIAFGLCIAEAVLGLFGAIVMIIAMLSGRGNNRWR